MESIFGGLLILGMIFLYLLPAGIAMHRKHKNAVPIAIFNLLLGWSVIVWIICLASAFSANVETKPAAA